MATSSSSAIAPLLRPATPCVVDRRLEVVGVHVVVELGDVGDEQVAEVGALLGRRRRPVLPRGRLAVGVQRILRRNPEVLLDAVEARPVEALGHGIHFAVVDARVEVAERLGDGLDALVVGAHLREGGARGIVVARCVGRANSSARGTSCETWSLTKAAYRSTACCFSSASGTVDGDRVARHAEAGAAHALADHAGLAEGEVVARLRDDGEGARGAGRDVLDLADDAQTVVGEQVELGHVAHRRS